MHNRTVVSISHSYNNSSIYMPLTNVLHFSHSMSFPLCSTFISLFKQIPSPVSLKCMTSIEGNAHQSAIRSLKEGEALFVELYCAHFHVHNQLPSFLFTPICFWVQIYSVYSLHQCCLSTYRYTSIETWLFNR